MAIVPDLGGGGPVDLKYNSPNRTAADAAAVVALTPLYPGEIVLATTTGLKYRGLSIVPPLWGQLTTEM